MSVSATPDMRSAAIEVGWNMRTGPDKFLGVLGRVVAAGSAVMRCGSGALALAYVAAGRSDAFIEHHINAWDCLAGNLLVAEAGGYVSDFLARDGLRKGSALLACTPGLRNPLAGLVALEGVELVSDVALTSGAARLGSRGSAPRRAPGASAASNCCGPAIRRSGRRSARSCSRSSAGRATAPGWRGGNTTCNCTASRAG